MERIKQQAKANSNKKSPEDGSSEGQIPGFPPE
jgi:hypothetical protein